MCLPWGQESWGYSESWELFAASGYFIFSTRNREHLFSRLVETKEHFQGFFNFSKFSSSQSKAERKKGKVILKIWSCNWHLIICKIKVQMRSNRLYENGILWILKKFCLIFFNILPPIAGAENTRSIVNYPFSEERKKQETLNSKPTKDFWKSSPDHWDSNVCEKTPEKKEKIDNRLVEFDQCNNLMMWRSGFSKVKPPVDLNVISTSWCIAKPPILVSSHQGCQLFW